jgi:diguanylate cyclase (GGDEF)-like protein
MMDHANAQAAVSDETPTVVHTAGATAMLVGLIVLIGWGFDIDLLKTVLPGYGSMEVGTAVAFILMGIALNEFARHNSRGSRLIIWVAAVTILLIAGTSVAEQFVDLKFGVGTLGSPATSPQTPMSVLSGGCLMLLASSLLLLPSSRLWTGRLLQGLVLTTLLISGLCLVGYAYDISSLFRFDPFASMAIHTAATMVVVCIGLLYARPDLEIMAPIRSQRLGGLAARTLLPAAVSVPLILGWAKLQGEVLGFYQLEFGTAVHTVSTIIAFAVLVWYCARTLNQADEQRDLAQRAQQELRILSECDPLTGVLNRRSLAERSEREWARAVRHNRSLSCIMVDLDGFKSVNDTHGHVSGDAVLKAVAELLIELCRTSDLVSRYGGEEFCIIAPETGEEAAANLAERLRAAIARHPIEVLAGTLNVTGSFGVAESRQEGDSVERLIARADDALLAAKRAGRNCIVVAEPPQKGTLALNAATPQAVVEVAEPALSPCE